MHIYEWKVYMFAYMLTHCFIKTEYWLRSLIWTTIFTPHILNTTILILETLHKWAAGFSQSIIHFSSCYNLGSHVATVNSEVTWIVDFLYVCAYMRVCLSWHGVVKGSTSSFLLKRDRKNPRIWNSVVQTNVWLDISQCIF